MRLELSHEVRGLWSANFRAREDMGAAMSYSLAGVGGSELEGTSTQVARQEVCMIEVCTVFAPRSEHEKWRDDYVHLMELQKKTAEHFCCRHVVVSDVAMPGFNCFAATLPLSLMHAMIVGVIARLSAPVQSDLLFVDVDCLIANRLEPAFAAASFDLGLTSRDNEVAPINNGAMYVPKHGAMRAKEFFLAALDRCQDHWGGDQEAISQVALPISEVGSIAERGGARVKFLDIRKHAVNPQEKGIFHQGKPYVIHFKGETKAWMKHYAARFILQDEAA